MKYVAAQTSRHICNPTTVETSEKRTLCARRFVPCREVVLISYGPLTEVPLCIYINSIISIIIIITSVIISWYRVKQVNLPDK